MVPFVVEKPAAQPTPSESKVPKQADDAGAQITESEVLELDDVKVEISDQQESSR